MPPGKNRDTPSGVPHGLSPEGRVRDESFECDLTIAGVRIRLASDISFPMLASIKRAPAGTPRGEHGAEIFISRFPEGFSPVAGLNAERRAGIMKVKGFQARWLDHPIVHSPAIDRILRDLAEFPYYSHFEMAWDRIIAKNFKAGRFHLFYPRYRETDINGPLFPAGFRNLIASVFPGQGAILVHGAGAVVREKAAVFLASDEGGKTTLSRFFPERNVLSDDQLVLKMAEQGGIACGTPFGTIGSESRPRRIGGFFLVNKSDNFQIVKSKGNRIIEFIWQEQMIHTACMPAVIRSGQFALISAIVSGTPCFRLSFPLSVTPVEMLGEISRIIH